MTDFAFYCYTEMMKEDESMKTNVLTWENVFDSRKRNWGWMWDACDYAEKGGYKYFLWNDRIYETEGQCKDTGFTVNDL